MAFFSKAGNILKQVVNKHAISETYGSNPSVFQMLRYMSSSKLFVGGISYSTDDTSLREAFNKYGEVVEARVIIDRDSGRSRGFGFVTYTNEEEASAAIQALDGQDLHGRVIRVNAANDRPPRSGGFGGGGFGGGFGGGDNYGGGNYGSYGGGGGGGAYSGGNNYGRGGSGSSYGGGGGDSYGGGNNFPQGRTYASGLGDNSMGSGNYGEGSQGFGVAEGGSNYASGGNQFGSNENGNLADAAGGASGGRDLWDDDNESDDHANRRA